MDNRWNPENFLLWDDNLARPHASLWATRSHSNQTATVTLLNCVKSHDYLAAAEATQPEQTITGSVKPGHKDCTIDNEHDNYMIETTRLLPKT